MAGEFSKSRQIIISEIRKLRSKAIQKHREGDRFDKDADKLQEELNEQ